MTRRWLILVGCVGCAALFGVPADAHHSFAVDYFESDFVWVEGELLQFQYMNPHSIMTILAKDDRGRAVTYSAEWGGTNRLQRDGITRDTFRVGDYLVLGGSPGRRAQDRKLHLKAIQRPADGWKWGRSR